MTRAELTIWKKGNKHGITKLYPTLAKARKARERAKRDKRYKRSQILRVRSEFYRDKMIRKKIRYAVFGTRSGTKTKYRDQISQNYKTRAEANKSVERAKETPHYATNPRIRKIQVPNWMS